MNKVKFKKSFISIFFLAVPVIFNVPLLADVPSEAEARLRAIYENGEFNAESFQAKWLDDSSGYTVLEPADDSEARILVSYSAASGERTILVSASELTPPGESAPLSIIDYEISPDSRRLVLECRNREQEANMPEIWRFEFDSGRLDKIADGRFFSISPGSRHVLYSDDLGNLYVLDFHNNQIAALTDNAVEDTVSNSRAVWSPEGNRIAFVESDVSDVRLRAMLVPGDPSYPEVKKVRFARVGGTIAALRVGVVDVQGTAVRWLSIPQPKEGFYIEYLGWAANSHEVVVEKSSRGRDKRDFLVADVNTGEITCIYRESDPAWVLASYRVNAGLEWIRSGKAFVLLSEQDGWRRAYVIQRDSGEKKVLTPEVDIIRRAGVDESGGWFYYYASPDNAARRYLYRARLDGKGTPERVTPADQSGTHEYDFSPDMKWAFHTRSAFDTPPVTDLVRLPEHESVRMLVNNQKLHEKVEPWVTRPAEFLKLDIGDGVVLDAYMIKPEDFDSAKKYPVFVYVYSEPHSQTVLDRWSTTNLFHRVIADLGYLIVSIDSRGTPAPKGAAWRRAIYPSLGPLSTEEQAEGLKALGRTRPYVDLSRVGIWGWSGGGSNTLNAMFRKPDLYDVGIAVAPKPQPHLYNAWFQEIYMRTREVNPEGYERSAPINFAEGLQGDLLIIHGTGETNTHLEITEGLVDRLIELGKTFDYMTYPNRDHGIRRGKGTSIHLRLLMTRYLLDHLPAGPR